MGKLKISIVGHYGSNSNMTDGQTVKVRSLISALNTYYPNIELNIVDTYFVLHKRLFKFLWMLFIAIITTKNFIFFPSGRGRRYMFRFFYILSKYFKKNCFHDCIAGSLDENLQVHPEWRKFLNSFRYNWMESPKQVEILKTMGIKNAEFLPNFKNLKAACLTDIISSSSECEFNFCIFSRILEMKGVEDAAIAIQRLSLVENVNAHLDIYGPIEPGEEEWFSNVLNKYKEFITYKGIVPYDKSVEVIKDYFALLFPTKFFNEGMPGTIIDAMFAGVPVIARKWMWCDNMITNGYNGISYDFEHPELLEEILINVTRHPSIITEMKPNCIQKSSEYSPESVCSRIVNAIFAVS
ncbi:MAG: glycosyltransferase [Prevotella sp.]|nr:glycosyltransferase [Prevotella sp.]